MDKSTSNTGNINTIEKLDFNKVTHEEKGFTTHLNLVLQHVHDALALGVWCYLSSLPTNWKINKSKLKTQFNMGREKLDNVLAILKKLDLIKFIRERNSDGTLGDSAILVKAGHDFNQSTGFQYTGCKSSKNKSFNQDTGLPESGSPVTGKQPLQKKQIQKKDFNTNKTKSSLDKKTANGQKHEFAQSMDQMASEAKHIEQHEEIKTAPMPQLIRDILHIPLKKMVTKNE